MANMTLGEAIVIAIQHCNEYSNSGELIESTDPNYQDLVLRMKPLANTSQMEIAKISKIDAKLSISQNPIKNQLGLCAFDEVQHYPGNDLTYTASASKSFSVEVDGDCTIYFDEEVSGVWTPISGTYSLDEGTPESFTGSISVSGLSDDDIQKYVNYRGLLTLSGENNVRMKIVATYPMKSRNRALFEYTFPSATKVPHYTAYIPYDLPDDYMEFNQIMHAFNRRQFKENKDYILTSDNKIHLSWDMTGQFDIHYWKYPAVINEDTDESYEFEVRPDGQSAIPWFMGGMAIYPTNRALGNRLVQQYYALVNNLSTPKSKTSTEIQNALWSTSKPRKLIDQIR